MSGLKIVRVVFYATRTKHEKIFLNSDWGTHYYADGDENSLDTALVEARDNFVARFGVVRYATMQTTKMNVFGLPNQEFYEDKLGRVIHIYSDVGPLRPSFHETSPLHTVGVPSGYRFIETTKSKHVMIKLLRAKFTKFPQNVLHLIDLFFTDPSKKRKKKEDYTNFAPLFAAEKKRRKY
jgi:hypothetical protein